MKSGRPASSASPSSAQRKGLLVGEHVLAERGAELGEPLDDFGEALFGRRRRAPAPARRKLV